MKKKKQQQNNKNYYLIYWTHRIQRNNQRNNKKWSILSPYLGELFFNIREQPILYSGYLIERRYKWLLKAALI